MADTTTTNYGLTKPEVGASEDTWGTKINTNLDTLDTTVDSIQGKSGAGVLKHTNNTKLATTSTGIDVTGDVNTSGLLKVGTNDTEYANNYLRFKPTGAAYIDHNTVGQAINFRLSNASSLDKTVMTLSSSGNALVGRTSSLSGQSGSVSANTVVSAHGPLSSHATNAGILEYYNDETLLRSYGANAGSGKLVFKVGGGGGSADSEAMRINSSGNVGIANSSLSNWASGYNALQVGGKAFFAAHSSSDSYFGQNAYVNSGWKYASTAAASFIQQSGGLIQFYVAPSGTADSAISWNAAMTVDNSGNLLVGTTDTTPGIGDTNAGISMSAVNGIIISRANDAPINISRNSSDGALTYFRKDGAIVGSIGTVVGRLSIGSGDTGVIFAGDIDAIYPANGLSARDNAIDIGSSGARFKDLYLSGDIAHKDAGGTARLLYDKSVNLLGNAGTNVEAYNVTVNNGVVFGTTGGSVSSKTLDDYEEGTWTPVIAGSGGGAYTYSASATPRYTRIGNLVTLSAAITNIELSGSGHAGYVQIQGAPFNKNSSTFATGTIELSNGDMSSGQTYATVSFITASSTTVMYIRQLGDNSNGADFPVGGINSGNTDFNFSITYQTA